MYQVWGWTGPQVTSQVKHFSKIYSGVLIFVHQLWQLPYPIGNKRCVLIHIYTFYLVLRSEPWPPSVKCFMRNRAMLLLPHRKQIYTLNYNTHFEKQQRIKSTIY